MWSVRDCRHWPLTPVSLTGQVRLSAGFYAPAGVVAVPTTVRHEFLAGLGLRGAPAPVLGLLVFLLAYVKGPDPAMVTIASAHRRTWHRRVARCHRRPERHHVDGAGRAEIRSRGVAALSIVTRAVVLVFYS
jgi:hypothetical protein